MYTLRDVCRRDSGESYTCARPTGQRGLRTPAFGADTVTGREEPVRHVVRGPFGFLGPRPARVVPLWPFLIKQTKISNRNRKPSNQNCKKLPPSPVFRRFGLKFQYFGFKPSNRIVKPNANAQTELVKF